MVEKELIVPIDQEHVFQLKNLLRFEAWRKEEKAKKKNIKYLECDIERVLKNPEYAYAYFSWFIVDILLKRNCIGLLQIKAELQAQIGAGKWTDEFERQLESAYYTLEGHLQPSSGSQSIYRLLRAMRFNL